MSRYPGQPSAKHVKESELLEAIERYIPGQPESWPPDVLAHKYPKNVVMAKVRKLEQRGLVKAWRLTEQGLVALASA